jgi:hypothetical protein
MRLRGPQRRSCRCGDMNTLAPSRIHCAAAAGSRSAQHNGHSHSRVTFGATQRPQPQPGHVRPNTTATAGSRSAQHNGHSRVRFGPTQRPQPGQVRPNTTATATAGSRSAQHNGHSHSRSNMLTCRPLLQVTTRQSLDIWDFDLSWQIPKNGYEAT